MVGRDDGGVTSELTMWAESPQRGEGDGVFRVERGEEAVLERMIV
jgi:hypothetical protein